MPRELSAETVAKREVGYRVIQSVVEAVGKPDLHDSIGKVHEVTEKIKALSLIFNHVQGDGLRERECLSDLNGIGAMLADQAEVLEDIARSIDDFNITVLGEIAVKLSEER